jgi:hypothetical protein
MHSLWNWRWACRDLGSHRKFSAARTPIDKFKFTARTVDRRCHVSSRARPLYGALQLGSVEWSHGKFSAISLAQIAADHFRQLGPVVAGITAERYGWRTFWWVSTALSCFSLVYQLLFLPETKWSHRHTQIVHDHITQPSKSNGEKPDTTLTEGSNSNLSSPAEESNTMEIVVKLSGKPSKRQFQLWFGFDNEEPILAAIILPFKLWAFPIIQWSSFVFSWCASCFLVINITQSQALAGPPWNFSPAEVGYTNFAIFVGALISLVTAGPLSDWVSMRATKKNRGIREPEMRLVALIPYACCTLLGGLIMAIGYQRAWPWEAIVVGGYTLIGIQLAAVSAIATTYAVSVQYSLLKAS